MFQTELPERGLSEWQTVLKRRQDRLERLLALEAPEIIVDTERRMIEEARKAVNKLLS